MSFLQTFHGLINAEIIYLVYWNEIQIVCQLCDVHLTHSLLVIDTVPWKVSHCYSGTTMERWKHSLPSLVTTKPSPNVLSFLWLTCTCPGLVLWTNNGLCKYSWNADLEHCWITGLCQTGDVKSALLFLNYCEKNLALVFESNPEIMLVKWRQ